MKSHDLLVVPDQPDKILNIFYLFEYWEIIYYCLQFGRVGQYSVLLLIMCPRYIISFRKNMHLSGCSFRLYQRILFSTSLRCLLCPYKFVPYIVEIYHLVLCSSVRSHQLLERIASAFSKRLLVCIHNIHKVLKVLLLVPLRVSVAE